MRQQAAVLWWLAYQHRHSYWVKSNLGFSNPSLSQRTSQQTRGLMSSAQKLKTETPRMTWSSLSQGRGLYVWTFFLSFLFFFFQILPRSTNTNANPFFPSYSIKWSSFLQLWLYRSSVSFQLVFRENCPTFWCLLGKQSYMSTYSNILIRPSFSFLVFHSTVKVLPKPGWDFKQYFEKPEGGTNF